MVKLAFTLSIIVEYLFFLQYIPEHIYLNILYTFVHVFASKK